MKTTVNNIVPHEDSAMEVHVQFRDDSCRTAPVANVIVFIDRQDHPLSALRSQAIKEALAFFPQITKSETKTHGT